MHTCIHVTNEQRALVTHQFFKNLIFPENPLASDSSSTRRTLILALEDTLFDAAITETMKAFGNDMRIGEWLKADGTAKLVFYYGVES